jgi:hypothetical protein
MCVAWIGAAGSAIMFFSLLILAIVAGSYLFAYASHCLLVVIEQTATGNDEVVWPDEPYLDWMWRGAFIAWQLLFWLVPIGIALKTAFRDIVAQDPALGVLLAGVALWLFLPIGLLSAMLGGSRWVVLHVQALRVFTRRPATTFAFYTSSFLVVAVGVLPWYLAIHFSTWLAPVASLIGAAAFLIYARLLGRLLWIATPAGIGKKRPKKRREGGEALPPLIMPRPLRRAEAPGEGYDLAAEEDMPAAADSEQQDEDRERDGYDLADDPYGEEKKQKDFARDLIEPARLRVAAASFRLTNPQTPRSLTAGVYSFPFYDRSLSPWLRLTLWGTVVGVTICLLLSGPV